MVMTASPTATTGADAGRMKPETSWPTPRPTAAASRPASAASRRRGPRPPGAAGGRAPAGAAGTCSVVVTPGVRSSRAIGFSRGRSVTSAPLPAQPPRAREGVPLVGGFERREAPAGEDEEELDHAQGVEKPRRRPPPAGEAEQPAQDPEAADHPQDDAGPV